MSWPSIYKRTTCLICPIALFALTLSGCYIDFDWLEDQLIVRDDESTETNTGKKREFADDYYVESTEPLRDDEYKLLIIGDSLSAAYEDVTIQDVYHYIAQPWLSDCGYNIRMANASVPGMKSAGGVLKLEEYLNEVAVQPTHVLIALGSNDGLQLEPVATLKENLKTLIEHIQKGGAKPLLAGNKLPDNFAEIAIAAYEAGREWLTPLLQELVDEDVDSQTIKDELEAGAQELNDYALDFARVFAELATEHDIPLWPNILHDVGGKPKLNQSDRIHPNAEGHRYMASYFVHFIKNKSGIPATAQATDACQFTSQGSS